MTKNTGVDDVFTPTLAACKDVTIARGLSSHGLPYMLFVLEGSLLLCGLKFGVVEGNTVIEKSAVMQRAIGLDLLNCATDDGFLLVASAGDLVCVPAGYLIVQCPRAPCVYLKWSCFPSHCPGVAKSVSVVVVSMLTELLSCFPQLSAPRSQRLMELLQAIGE